MSGSQVQDFLTAINNLTVWGMHFFVTRKKSLRVLVFIMVVAISVNSIPWQFKFQSVIFFLTMLFLHDLYTIDII